MRIVAFDINCKEGVEMKYDEFLESKRIIDSPTGLTDIPELNPMLFDFQRDIVRWALRCGRAQRIVLETSM